LEIPFGRPNIPKECGNIEIGWDKKLAIRKHFGGILVKVVMLEHVQNQPRKKNAAAYLSSA